MSTFCKQILSTDTYLLSPKVSQVTSSQPFKCNKQGFQCKGSDTDLHVWSGCGPFPQSQRTSAESRRALQRSSDHAPTIENLTTWSTVCNSKHSPLASIQRKGSFYDFTIRCSTSNLNVLSLISLSPNGKVAHI